MRYQHLPDRHYIPTLAGAAVVVLALAVATPCTGTSMVSFVHVSTADNISGFLTEMDHPRLNDNPYARVFVTQAWNNLSGEGAQNDRAIGVRYDVDFTGDGRWSIFNQDYDYDMEPDLMFHVVVAGEGTPGFLHLTHHDNIQNIASFVNCPPDYITYCYGGAGTILHGHTLNAGFLDGARQLSPVSGYRSGTSLLVRAESVAGATSPNMRPGALYWIMAGTEILGGTQAFTHTATTANTVGWATKLDHPQLNGNPDVVLLVTRAGPAGPPQDDHIGVLYANDGSADIWSVIHQTTGTTVPEGSHFSVLIAPLMADGFESGDTSWWSAATP